MTRNAPPSCDARPVDLRPGGVLPIGLAGDESVFHEAYDDAIVKAVLAGLMRRLMESLQEVIVANSDYFSNCPALCRILTMLRSNMLPLAAGDALGEAQVIDIDAAASQPTSRAQIDSSGEIVSLDRAREQTHQLLLANIDLLLVVWDGKRAERRGGIDALVQSAVTRRLPVIVIPPTSSEQSYMFLQNEDDLDERIALDLERRSIPTDLRPLIRKIMLPPWGGARRCLMDLCAQPQRPASLRIEYDLLLTAFRVRTKVCNSSAAAPFPCAQSPNSVPAEFRNRIERIDQLAGYYANLTRASSTSEFLVLIIVALLSSAFGLLVPSLSGISIVIQVIVNGLILIDITIRRRHHWVQRWLDYRALTERLRAVQTLHPIGQGDGQHGGHGNQFHTWTDWYCRRIQRMLIPPNAPVQDADLPAIADSLRAVIGDQLSYHRRAFVQLRKLERRLRTVAHISLLTTILIGAAIFLADLLHIGASDGSWRRLALLALAVLPAAVSAFNGIRADSDLAQLVERSALTATRLMRLRRGLNGSPLTRDRVINAAIRLARLMEDELSEWRLMLNNRRLRRLR
jgi:hypothetical protein